MKKRKQEVRFKLDILQLQTNALKHSHQGLTFQLRIFDELLQLSSSLKFAKAELYLIGGCQNEWFELTYYIETLIWMVPKLRVACKKFIIQYKTKLVWSYDASYD